LNQLTEQSLLNTTNLVAAEVSDFIDESFTLSRTMAAMFASSAHGNSENREPVSREAVQGLIGDVLAVNEQLGSAYAHFEPDGYDQLDAQFENSGEPHSAQGGTLEVYWVRDAGELVYYPTESDDFKYLDTVDEFGFREAEWYLCSMDSLEPCIMEPYLYEIEAGLEILMTSLVYPIVTGGTFRGVAGVDINMPDVQADVADYQADLLEGAAEIYLVSDIGCWSPVPGTRIDWVT